MAINIKTARAHGRRIYMVVCGKNEYNTQEFADIVGLRRQTVVSWCQRGPEGFREVLKDYYWKRRRGIARCAKVYKRYLDDGKIKRVSTDTVVARGVSHNVARVRVRLWEHYEISTEELYTKGTVSTTGKNPDGPRLGDWDTSDLGPRMDVRDIKIGSWEQEQLQTEGSP